MNGKNHIGLRGRLGGGNGLFVFFLFFFGGLVKQRCKHFEIGGDKKRKGAMY